MNQRASGIFLHPTSLANAYPIGDPTPQIAKRAYELYEQRGRQNGQTDQDWLQAEREIKLAARQRQRP